MAGDDAAMGPNGTALPMRYACHVCGICIATSEALLETRDDVAVFRCLHFADDANKATKTVLCPGCEQAVGTRGDNKYFMRKDRVLRRRERLEILVCGLKQQEISALSPLLLDAFPHSNINARVLTKPELRGYQLSGVKPTPELVVVVHRSEGRLLLTDRNGFYHDILGSAWQLTRGNVFVVLTRVESVTDGDLYDMQLLRTLSSQGDQPTIGAIGTLGRVLTWESSPSKAQLKQLQQLTAKAYFREAAAAPQGIPAQWSTKQPQKAATSTWCSLL